VCPQTNNVRHELGREAREREDLGEDRRQARGVFLGVALPPAGRVDLREIELASVSQPLADLAHQRTARLQLAMARSKEEKASRPVDCPPPVLYIKTRFRHSKLEPLKQEIYDVQAHQRKIQRDATNLKHGKPTEYDWDWPEDVVTSRRRSARRSVGRRGAAELV
jgi:hypothetical protein